MKQSYCIFYFLDIINCDLVMLRNRRGYMVQIQNAKVKDKEYAVDVFGLGRTEEDAVLQYIDKIKGKEIIVNFGTEKHRTYIVPTEMHYTSNPLNQIYNI
jgi:hypothetical protein